MSAESRPAVEVVVCVPTFRREAHLIRLLDEISHQDYLKHLVVVVADNDHENPTMAKLDIPTNLNSKLFWFTVEERGVAIVRNRLVEFALQKFSNVQWLAFIDDDEVPPVSWLRTLVKNGIHYSSDLVGGPVQGRLPADASILARRSTYASTRRQPSGPVDMLVGTNNLLVSAKFIRGIKRLPFLAEFGRTGGEDYEFLRYAKSSGAKFSWSEEAGIWENVEPHRLTTRAILKRYVGVSAYHARIDRRYLGWHERVRNLFRRVRWLGAAAVRSIGGVEFKKNLAETMLAAAATTGYISGLCGIRIRLY